jgi:hypothetical protein
MNIQVLEGNAYDISGVLAPTFTVRGGNFYWSGGLAPSFDLQSNNSNGNLVAEINTGIFSNDKTVSISNDSKADIDVRINNCAVNNAQFNFLGNGGTFSVKSNCLNPVNVNVSGTGVLITPDEYAQNINVTGTPSNYTPTAPPAGFLTGSQQHFEGIDDKLGDIDSSITSIDGDITTIQGDITTINSQLDAYNYSGSTSTFDQGDLTVTRSNSGGTVTFNNSNTSNTASSDARLVTSVAGSSAGDAYQTLSVSGVTSFSQGIDNSDSDNFKRTFGADLNSNVYEVVTTAGEITHPLQPAFLAYLAASQTNKTGNGATYQLGTDALTEVFDQSGDFNTNGTFTASVSGRYTFFIGVRVTNCTVAANLNLNVVTSNRTAQYLFSRAAGNPAITGHISFITDMDAADTLTAAVIVTGEAADTNTVFGAANVITYMSGFKAA